MEQHASVKKLTGNHLKLIACAAMFTDHACKALTRGTFLPRVLVQTVGRVAFPIFAFLLLEGFLHTKSRRKYAVNLLITALLSEIPFDLAFHRTFFYWQKQNTCFTLLLGLLLFVVLEKCEQVGKPLLMLPAAAGFACAFHFARVDYGYIACLVFLALYFLRFHAAWFKGLIANTILFAGFRMAGVYLSTILLALYNGKRGRAPAPVKYLFYAFYPAHLALLVLIRQIIRAGI